MERMEISKLVNATDLVVLEKPNKATKLTKLLNTSTNAVTLSTGTPIFKHSEVVEINSLVSITSLGKGDQEILANELLNWKARRKGLMESPIDGYEEQMKKVKPEKQEALENLISEFSHIFARTKTDTGRNPFWAASIELKGDPQYINAKNYKSLDKLEERKMVDNLESQGTIEKCISNWSSPMLLIEKPGKKRCVVNFSHREKQKKTVNSQIIVPQYPIQTLRSIFQDMSESIHKLQRRGKITLSTVDLRNAFFVLPLVPSHRDITSFTSGNNMFRYSSLPQGLASSPAIYTKLMKTVLENIPTSEDYTILSYLDDVVTVSLESAEMTVMRLIFKEFERQNMVVGLKKCDLFRETITFLGHKISTHGIGIPSERVESLAAMRNPTTKLEAQKFCGCFAFYGRKIRGVQRHLGSLHKEIAKKKFMLNDQIKTDLEELRKTLRETKACSHIRYPETEEDRILIASDASLVGKGGVFGSAKVSKDYEISDIKIHSYYSAPFDGPEEYLSSRARELISLASTVEHFEDYLREDMPLLLVTDHKSLASTTASPKLPKASNTRTRKAYGKLMTYSNSEICYMDNESSLINVCDALSRMTAFKTTPVKLKTFHPDVYKKPSSSDEAEMKINEISTIPGTVQPRRKDPQESRLGCPNQIVVMVRKAQESDNRCRDVLQRIRSGKKVERFSEERGVLLTKHKGSWKIYLPECGIGVLKALHSYTGHGSRARMNRGIDDNNLFVKNKEKQLSKIANGCLVCLLNKTDKRTEKVKASFKPSFEPHSHVFMDLITLKVGNQEVYFHTAICQFSRHLWAARCANKKSRTTARNLSLYAMRFNLCGRARVITDNGQEFLGSDFQEMANVLGISLGAISAYNKTANLVERQHRVIRSFLATTTISMTDVNYVMETAICQVNNSPHEALNGWTPNMVIMNSPPPRLVPMLASEKMEPRTMEEIEEDNLANFRIIMEWKKGRLKSQAPDKKANLQEGDFCAMRSPKSLGHANEVSGPYVISKANKNNSFTLKCIQTDRYYTRNSKDLCKIELDESEKTKLMEEWNLPINQKSLNESYKQFNPFWNHKIPLTDHSNRREENCEAEKKLGEMEKTKTLERKSKIVETNDANLDGNANEQQNTGVTGKHEYNLRDRKKR